MDLAHRLIGDLMQMPPQSCIGLELVAYPMV
jgi:hypothetical protein